jgi:hypothetical protein
LGWRHGEREQSRFKDQLFSRPPANEDGKPVLEITGNEKKAALAGPLHSLAESTYAPRDDRDSLDRIDAGQAGRY